METGVVSAIDRLERMNKIVDDMRKIHDEAMRRNADRVVNAFRIAFVLGLLAGATAGFTVGMVWNG